MKANTAWFYSQCAVNNELQEKVHLLEEQLNSMKTKIQSLPAGQDCSTEIDELKNKSQSQVAASIQ